MDRFEIILKNNTCLEVYRSIYTPVASNMFIIIREQQALVIDPNIDDEVAKLFYKHNINNVYILLTHEHYDHTSGVLWFQEHYNCKLVCNKSCGNVIGYKRNNNPLLVAFVLANKDNMDGGSRYLEFMQSFKPYSLSADIIYDTPCVFHLLGMNFKGTQTPGHSPGSWCLLIEDAFVITGDTLIKDTPIIIRFAESSEHEFKTITLPFLKSLDGELMVLPGHFDPFKMKDNNIIHTYDV